MKSYFAIIFMTLFFVKVSSQELMFDLAYSNSSLAEYKNFVGFDIGYAKFTKSLNKIGIDFTDSYNLFSYDYINLTDAGTYLITEVKPKSYIWRLQGSYAFLLRKNNNDYLFIGPLVSLNYFGINESVHRLPNGSYSETTYNLNTRYNNKLSIGFIFEYQSNDVLFSNLDLLYAICPSIGNFEDFSAMGSNNPWFYLAIDFKIGLCYDFGKNKE